MTDFKDIIDSFISNSETVLTEYPEGQIKQLKNKIKNKIKTSDEWENAADAVKAGFEEVGIPVPDITEEKKWSQYTDLISFAVTELSKLRGSEGKWRVSKPMELEKFKVVGLKEEQIIDKNQIPVLLEALQSNIATTQSIKKIENDGNIKIIIESTFSGLEQIVEIVKI